MPNPVEVVRSGFNGVNRHTVAILLILAATVPNDVVEVTEDHPTHHSLSEAIVSGSNILMVEEKMAVSTEVTTINVRVTLSTKLVLATQLLAIHYLSENYPPQLHETTIEVRVVVDLTTTIAIFFSKAICSEIAKATKIVSTGVGVVMVAFTNDLVLTEMRPPPSVEMGRR